jgi:HTH-type transcriptional regulator/antitoxin HipB
MTPIGSTNFNETERWHRLLKEVPPNRSRTIMQIRTILDAAAVVRGRRVDLDLSQAALADRAGVSRKWVYEFEAGKPNAELGVLLRVLSSLGLELSADAKSASTSANETDLDRLLDDYRR